MNLRWSHCVLKVRDLEGMISFYEDLLDFRVADRGPLGPEGAPEIVFMSGSSSDHHQMALLAARGPEEASSLDHNAFRVDELANVKTMFGRASADERAVQVMPLTHGNAISVYFRDPEGNGIEVFWDSPWHAKQPAVSGWDPSLSDEQVLAAVEKDYRDHPEFGPMEDYRAQMAERFGEKG
jgi:catechol-2,3-dioxygenase